MNTAPGSRAKAYIAVKQPAESVADALRAELPVFDPLVGIHGDGTMAGP